MAKSHWTPSTPNPVKIIEAAMGGPFVSLSEQARFEAEIEQGVVDVQNTLTFESNVRDAVSDLPLVKPMAQVTKISSFFGYRKDPLRLSLASMAVLISRQPMGNPYVPRRMAGPPGLAHMVPMVTLLKSFMTTGDQPGMVT